MSNMKAWLVAFALSAACFNSYAADSGFPAALASPDRPAADKERDAARKPAQVIEFLGIESGMTVLDALAGAGYYTEVLSGAVGPDGKVVSQNSEWILQIRGGANAAAMKEKAARLGNVEILLRDFNPAQLSPELASRLNVVNGPIDLGPLTTRKELYDGKIDVAITALNLHDAYIFGGEAGAMTLLQNIFTALKPGGVLGVIDHVGIAGQNNSRLHRIEKGMAVTFLKYAGFVIEAESDLLANPKDDHTLPMRDPSLERNTDRMLIKARKPADS